MTTAPSNPRAPFRWCLYLAIALLFLGAILNVFFLFNHCPFQLSDDEAHYWEWSRHLDYGYYSKPPGIAWLMYGTLKIAERCGVDPNSPGEVLMPILRLPAVLFGVLSGLLSLFLARRIFNDNRAALAVILLSAAVPMFAIGSLLITIDSPMYLCWAATVYCLWRHIENAGLRSQKSVSWLYLGALACALGMLFKPVLIVIPLCAIIAAVAEATIRRALKTWHAAAAIIIMLASQIPVVIWNANHNWVTFRHMGTQGGFTITPGAKPTNWLSTFARVGEYVGGQAGGMGGLIFILLVIAIIIAVRLLRRPGPDLIAEYSELRTQNSGLVFLLSFTLPLWIFYFLLSLWKGTEVNWPAASYFTGMILLGGIFTAGWNSAIGKTRRWWHTFGTITIAWGIVVTAIVMNLHRFYPLFPKLAKMDPAAMKLRGFEERAAQIDTIRQQLRDETHQEPLIISNRYGTSSSLSFYLPDHPRGGETVFCLMSSTGGRQNQYDLWPGPDQAACLGRPAILVGFNPADPAVESLLKPAFLVLERPDTIPITTRGVPIKTITIYRGYGFKGFPKDKADIY